MTDLSPAAQSVWDAAFEPWQTTDTPASIAAAVLRATSHRLTSAKAIDTLRALADELEAYTND